MPIPRYLLWLYKINSWAKYRKTVPTHPDVLILKNYLLWENMKWPSHVYYTIRPMLYKCNVCLIAVALGLVLHDGLQPHQLSVQRPKTPSFERRYPSILIWFRSGILLVPWVPDPGTLFDPWIQTKGYRFGPWFAYENIEITCVLCKKSVMYSVSQSKWMPPCENRRLFSWERLCWFGWKD